MTDVQPHARGRGGAASKPPSSDLQGASSLTGRGRQRKKKPGKKDDPAKQDPVTLPPTAQEDATAAAASYHNQSTPHNVTQSDIGTPLILPRAKSGDDVTTPISSGLRRHAWELNTLLSDVEEASIAFNSGYSAEESDTKLNTDGYEWQQSIIQVFRLLWDQAAFELGAK
jgi:hypothetical protein